MRLLTPNLSLMHEHRSNIVQVPPHGTTMETSVCFLGPTNFPQLSTVKLRLYYWKHFSALHMWICCCPYNRVEISSIAHMSSTKSMRLLQLRMLVFALLLRVVSSNVNEATDEASTSRMKRLQRSNVNGNATNLRSNQHRHLPEVNLPKTPQV